jgi:hypothetical protein
VDSSRLSSNSIFCFSFIARIALRMSLRSASCAGAGTLRWCAVVWSNVSRMTSRSGMFFSMSEARRLCSASTFERSVADRADLPPRGKLK